MKNFKDFNINVKTNTFSGPKIKISRVLNRPITVHDFKIEESNFAGKRVDMQIEMGGTKHVLFTGSKVLMDMIQRIPKEGFPFETTIVEENQMFMFT